MHYPGHSVLQVPVPQLEPWIRARTAHHDASFVSADPTHVHAHVTALGPFVTELDPATAAQVAQIAARVEPFDFTLAEIDTFPNGIIHLRPDPDGAFVGLTQMLMEAFPEHPPYGGLFPPVPHLTLDLVHGDVTEASTLELLGDLVPVNCRAERLDLAWYESGNCHRMASWPLGS